MLPNGDKNFDPMRQKYSLYPFNKDRIGIPIHCDSKSHSRFAIFRRRADDEVDLIEMPHNVTL